MKEVVYGYWIQQDRELLSLTQQRMAQLEEVLGASGSQVSAEWDRSADARGEAVVTLRLSDFTGSATTVFQPEELKDPSHMRTRFYLLWSALLQVRIQHQLQELQEAGSPEKE
ncbi:MAG: hypothetical protein JO112_06565 [Planctomycetes bacterium]|nr:hypothetical protein [Planctomycetota bacterium]